MGLLAFAKNYFSKRASLVNPPRWLYDSLLGGASTSSGIVLNETRAYNLSAVWNAVRAISGDIASLPLCLYRKQDDGGRERADDHPLYPILHDSIGPMTSFSWLETMLSHLLIYGNSYTRIYRDGVGKIVSLQLFHPNSMISAYQDEYGKITYYLMQTLIGSESIQSENILHIRGLSSDGLFGKGVLDVASESLGLATAEMSYQSYYFGNNASPPGFIIVPGRANEQTLAALRKSWEDMYRGIKHSGKPGILWEGMTYQLQNNTPADAQLLELRKFSVNEICRWFNIPAIKLQDNNGSVSYNSGEVQNRQYYDATLRPWMSKIETECRCTLLSELERQKYYIEFVPAALLKADTVGRAQAYEIGIRSGYLAINDVRRMESLPPVEGGDINLVPLNYTPLAFMAKQEDPEPDPEPEDPIDAPMADEDPEGDMEDEAPQDQGATRSQKTRLNFAKAYRRMFADSAERLLKREAYDVRNALKKVSDMDELRAWANEYYLRESYIGIYMSAAISTYVDAVGSDLVDEYGIGERDFDAFVVDYMRWYASQHKEASLLEITDVSTRDGAAGALEAMLNAWLTDRHWAIADRQTVEIESALRMYLEV